MAKPKRCCRCRGSPAAAIIAVAAIAISGIAVLERSSPVVSYLGDGWVHECAKWDEDGNRFLVSTFFDGGVAEVPAGGGTEERVVVPGGGDVQGMKTVGIHVDRPRRRLLVVYAGSRRSAVAAYGLRSWERIFLTFLAGPDEPSNANDVIVDPAGNAFVTDSQDSKIWKVNLEGELVSTLRNSKFTASGGLFSNLIGLNGIVYHTDGYLLASHTSSGRLLKIDVQTEAVTVVGVKVMMGDGLLLLSPTKLVVSGLFTCILESSDGWETAKIVGRYTGLIHRVPSTSTMKDGKVFVNHLIGYGFPKKTHVIAEAIFSPPESSLVKLQ